MDWIPTGDSVTFNGKKCEDYGLEVLDITRPYIANSKTTYVDIPSRDGAVEIYDDTHYDVTVKVSFALHRVAGKTMQQTIRDSLVFFTSRYKEDLIFSDDSRYAWHAKVDGEVIPERIADSYFFDVIWRCDPYPRPLGGGL